MNFNPIGDRVLIERTEFETSTSGGLIIPNHQDKSNEGRIIALGIGLKNTHIFLKKNDVVKFSQPKEIIIKGKEYVLVDRDNVLGIFND